ncbi:MAG TPA: cytochrome c biogenesis protein CcdA [Polyangiaceae bacterium]|nr:cytochrome c biogenesis protein CcdA [Polyangiaceae bacterium]
MSSPDAFTQALAKGPLYAALAALVGGLAVSLTPCVYPMIAVTVSIFGAKQAKRRSEGMLLSLAFVLGIAGMLVPLGVVAGMSGSMFGAVLQSRAVIVAIAVLFGIMALSMFGAFELTLPSSLNNKLAEMGGIGYKGAFALGWVCGLIATPCTGPVLTGILAWISIKQSASLGALAMGAFSAGLGAPFFLVGAFAVQLPKSGRWMVHVKSVLGIVLLMVALYLLNNSFGFASALISSSWGFIGAAAALALVGLLAGAVHREFSEPGAGVKLAKGFGIAAVSLGGLAAILGIIKPAEALAWERKDIEGALARAAADKRPLVVDFTAAWCGACKELDKRTFSEPRVGQELGRFVAVKVDATNNDDPKVEAMLARFKVLGLPTVVLFDSRGKEAARFNDFVPPDEFLKSVQNVD